MIGELQKRPESKHRNSARPKTGQLREANRRQSEESFQMGKEHMKRGQHEQALNHYFNATMHDPNNYKAFCNMGTIFRTLGNYKQAKFAYVKSLRAKPDDTITLYNYGNLLRITGNDEDAICQYEKVIKMKEHQLYGDALINMGICFKNVGLYDEAIEIFDKAIQFRPNDQSGYFNKAMCYFKILVKINETKFGKVKEQMFMLAQKTLKKVIEINPSNSICKIGLIQLNYLKEPIKEVFEKSVEELKAILEKSDQKVSEYINMKIGYCMAALKKFKESSEYYKQGGIGKDTNSIKESIKRQTQYDSFPSMKKKERRQSQSGKQNLGQNQDRPKSSRNYQSEMTNGKQIPMKQQFDQYLKRSQYSEAFKIVNSMPEGVQKYESHIILNAKEGDQMLLQTSKTIYIENILKNDLNTPITKQICSIQCHHALATILTELEDHEQATKHYEVLAEHYRDEKMGNDSEELQRLYGDMGNNYAERKLWDKAIQEYKKQLKLQPQNYFALSNLAECLMENDREDEALKLFEEYLQHHKLEQSEEKAKYIDCLINISICLKDKKGEFEALKKAQEELQKYFPSYDDIIKHFEEINIETLYLRLTEMHEEKYNKELPPQQKRQANEKLLDLYLSCLQFPSCPDRQEININCGNLFYLNQNYANALNFYRKVQDKKHLVTNNIALTLANLEQHDMALPYMKYAIENSPNNPVYQMNFMILKWMYGIVEEDDNNFLVQQFPCRCEIMGSERVAYGLGLIENITEKIISEESIKNLQMNQMLKDMIKDSSSVKMNFLKQKIQEHLSSVKHGDLPSKYQIDSLLELCMNPLSDFKKQFEGVIMPAIENLPKNMLNISATQLAIYTTILVNHGKIEEIEESLKSQQLQTQVFELNTKAFTESGESYFIKEQEIRYPNIDLNVKTFLKMLKEVECIIETNNEIMLEHIAKVYYSNHENILGPLRIERIYPHSQQIQEDANNFIKALKCIKNFSGFETRQYEINLTQNSKHLTDRFIKDTLSHFNHELKEGRTRNYIQDDKKMMIELDKSNLPIIVKTHHKDKKNALEFIHHLDEAFGTFDIGSVQPIGRVEVIINKSVKMELIWGEVSETKRFITSIYELKINPVLISLLEIGDDLTILGQLSSGHEGLTERYKKLLNLA